MTNFSENMNERPAISVIIPVYNTQLYVGRCLDSILKQTFKNIEIICVNDGSTDDSLAILNSYAEKDSRIIVIKKENGGVSQARNTGIEAASGKYITFVDSDDCILEDTLAKVFHIAEENNLDIVEFSADIEYADENMKEKFNKNEDSYAVTCGLNQVMTGESTMMLQQEKGEFFASVCMKLINLDYLKSINLSFYPGIIHEDELFVALLVSKAQRVMAIPDRFYIRIIRENSIMTSDFSYKNFIGTFYSYVEISRNYMADGFRNKALGMRMLTLFRIASGRYQRLSDDDKAVVEEKIIDEYKYIFKSFKEVQDKEQKNLRLMDQLVSNKERMTQKDAVIQDYQRKLAEKDERIVEKNNQLVLNKERMAQKDEVIKDYKQKLIDKDAIIKDYRCKLTEKDKKISEKINEITTLQNSSSYKIGRAITWLPRKVKKLLKK